MMGTTTVVLDCGLCVEPDLGTVECLARLHVAARRRGCELRLANASPCLADLIGFAGLGGVLRVEVKGQAEQREQPRGVEEERELGDPPA
jgi:hypothetical protein